MKIYSIRSIIWNTTSSYFRRYYVVLQHFERLSSQTDLFNIRRNTIHSVLSNITVCRGSWHSVGMGTAHATYFYQKLLVAPFFTRICITAVPPVLGFFIFVRLLLLLPVSFFCEVTIRICIRGSSKRPT